MVFACGISSYSITMFHLMNHAFFKALLFLSAGAIIHAMHDEQDMRKMGALNRLLPFTYTMTLIGSFALIGFPFLTGFYSKDFILEVACSKLHFSGNFAYWLGTLSVTFTTFYSYRLVFLTFLNRTNSFKQWVIQIHETNPISPMGIPLLVLAIGSLFIGYLSKDMIVGLGTTFWGNSIFVLSEHTSYLEAEYLPYHIKAIPLIFGHIGAWFAYHTTAFFSSPTSRCADDAKQNLDASFQKNLIFYNFHTKLPIIRIYTFFNQKWHVDDFYNRFIVQKVLNFGYHTSFKLFDAGWIAYLGPYGIASTVTSVSKKFSQLQTGFVYHYAFIILVALVIGTTFALAGGMSFQHDALAIGWDYSNVASPTLSWVFLFSFYVLSLFP